MVFVTSAIVVSTRLPDLGPGGLLFFAVVLVASLALAVSLGILSRQRFRHDLRQIVQTLEDLRTGRARGRPEVTAGSTLALVSDAVHRLGQDLHGRFTDAEQAAERWRALSDANKDAAIVTTDTDGDVRSFGGGATEIFGWEEDEVLAQPAAVLFEESAYKELLPKLARRSLRRQGISTRSLLARRDGSRFEGEVTVRLLQGSASQPVGFMLVVRDITEQVRTERELRAAERRYRGLVEGLSEGVLIVKQGAVVYANPAAEGLCGRPGGELIGRSARELVATAEVLVVEEALAAVELGAEQGREFECTLRDDRGFARVEARIRASRIEFDGGAAVLLLVRDEGLERRLALEVRRNETRLDAVLEATADGVLVLADAVEGEFVQMVNRSFTTLVALDPAEVLGVSAGRLVVLLRERARGGITIADALTGERVPGSTGDREGREDLRVTVATLVGRSGEPLGRVVVCRDLSEQRRSERELQAQTDQLQLSKVELEQSYRRLNEANQKLLVRGEELQQLNQELRRLDEMKSALLGNVSHELQTPLVSIRGYTETILRERLGPITPEQRKGLEIALKNIDRLISMIDNLLAFNRTDPLSRELKLSEFDLGSLVREVQDLLKERIGRKRIDLSLAFPGDAIAVRADRDQVLQVFVNLLSNAVKFTPEGGAIVVAADVGPAGYVAVRVKDTGVGISSGELGKIFERHYRVERKRGGGAEGSGIGLAIVRDILRLHGCTIDVQSEEGRGTEFSFTLPGTLGEDRAVGSAEPTQAADDAPRSRLRIIRPRRAE